MAQRDLTRPALRYLVSPNWQPTQPGTLTTVAWLSTDPAARAELQVQEGRGKLQISVHGVPTVEQWLDPESTQTILKTASLKLTKTRYLYAPTPWEQEEDTGRWLIDIYGPEFGQGEERLIIARLEGPAPQRVPECFTTNVTGDPRYHGGWLIRYGKPDPALQAYLVTVPIRASELHPHLRPPRCGPDDILIARAEVEAANEQDAALRGSISVLRPSGHWLLSEDPPSQLVARRQTSG